MLEQIAVTANESSPYRTLANGPFIGLWVHGWMLGHAYICDDDQTIRCFHRNWHGPKKSICKSSAAERERDFCRKGLRDV